MPQLSAAQNPFMLMTNPELVVAAMEKSERLSQLNRHLCRPLDRPVVANGRKADDEVEIEAEEDERGE